MIGVVAGVVVAIAAVVVLVVLPMTRTPDPGALLAEQGVTDATLARGAGTGRARVVVSPQDRPATGVTVTVSCTGRDVARVYLDGTWEGGVPCGGDPRTVAGGDVTVGDAVDLGVEHVVEVEAAPGAVIAVTVATAGG
ncbi:hypothetical protein GXP71_13770 [Cellulomonas sp. H30R-01]|uniref:hypothetical protein n=1 Tax=Cellulomonas sp. H30R-01 TaxID=2704467 RepID=UPI00138C309B|nr:hypothetical protein [Cellulomonas sp. H30R-01]QHT57041.1 hypothetical protein GXP71_13770 [Cellulomonas sp. H30R-01]